MFYLSGSGQCLRSKGRESFTKSGDTLSSRHVSSCDITRAVGGYRRFNIEFYDADSLFCHSAVQSTRQVGHASRNVCDNRNVRGVLAREPTRAPRDVSRVTEE
jgi:hypothetical protein